MLSKYLSNQVKYFYKTRFVPIEPIQIGRILFFGSDEFAIPTLQKIKEDYMIADEGEKRFEIEVVTRPHKSKSKSHKDLNKVSLFCQEYGIHMWTPVGNGQNDQISQEWKDFNEGEVFNYEFDIGVVVNYGQMIPDFIIDRFKYGMVVVHPSILPKYRGASPIQHTLMNGDNITGTTVLEVSKGQFDAGRILVQKRIPIIYGFTYHQLSTQLAKFSGDTMVEYLNEWQEFNRDAKKQDETKITRAPKLKQSDTFLKWASSNNIQMTNQFRAFKGTQFRSVRTKFNGKELFIENMELPRLKENQMLSEYKNAKPGSLWLVESGRYKNNIYVKCGGELDTSEENLDSSENCNFARITSLRFIDQKPDRESYKFLNEFLNRDTAINNKEAEGHWFFEEME